MVEDQRIYMLDILSKWGAPFNIKDDHGDTPLDMIHVDTREDVIMTLQHCTYQVKTQTFFFNRGNSIQS